MEEPDAKNKRWRSRKKTVSKQISGTCLNVRMSYKAKVLLMKKVEELKQFDEFDGRITVSDLVRVAVLDVWGIDCNEYDD